jgi:glutathione peroxidase-family protein
MNLYEITINTLDGRPQLLADFRGLVLLIVNVAWRHATASC